MQYTITDINGGVVSVSFADGSYANVQVDSSLTLDQIDTLVGQYNTEYITNDTPNPNIFVGDVRETIDPEVAEAARQEQIEQDRFNFDWGNTGEVMDTVTAYMLAQKLAYDGDSSFLDMINARLDHMICQHSDYSLDALKTAFNDTI